MQLYIYIYLYISHCIPMISSWSPVHIPHPPGSGRVEPRGAEKSMAFPCCRVWLPEGNTQRYVQSDQRGESPEISFRNFRSFWVRIKLRDSPLWICCRTSLKNLIQLLLHVAAAFWRCRSMGWRIFGAKIRSDYENTKACGMESGLSFGDRDFLTTSWNFTVPERKMCLQNDLTCLELARTQPFGKRWCFWYSTGSARSSYFWSNKMDVLEPISGSLQTPFLETNLGSEHLEMLATQTLNMSKNRHHQKPATFSREDL